MAAHNDHALHLARAALESFGATGRLRKVATGLDTTYRVVTGDGRRLSLRIGGALGIRSHAAVAAEAAWIDALHRAGDVRVPRVVAGVDGRLVVQLVDRDGRARQAMLATWLSGRKLRSRVTARQAAALGGAAAALHLHAATDPVDTSGLKRWGNHLMTADLAPLAAVIPPDVLAALKAIDHLVAAACADLGDAAGIINADLGPHNTVWDSSDDRPGLFDFNDTGVGPYALDLARCVRTLRRREKGEVLAAGVLDGYQAVAPLPKGWHEHGAVFEAAWDLFLARHMAPNLDRRGPDAAEAVRRLARSAAAAIGSSDS